MVQVILVDLEDRLTQLDQEGQQVHLANQGDLEVQADLVGQVFQVDHQDLFLQRLQLDLVAPLVQEDSSKSDTLVE